MLREDLAVGVGDVQLHARLRGVAQEVAGVLAAAVDVAERVVGVVGVHGRDHVVRVRRQRVGGHGQDHAADLGVRDDLVGDPGGQRAGHQFVVDGLVEVRLRQLLLRRVDPARHERLVQHRVDLVEGQPVLDPVAVSLENRAAVALEEADQLAAGPAVVLPRQGERGLVVRQRHQRLDAVPGEFVEDAGRRRRGPPRSARRRHRSGRSGDQAMDVRNTVKPISANSAMSSA